MSLSTATQDTSNDNRRRSSRISRSAERAGEREEELAVLDAALSGDVKAWDRFCRRYQALIIGCVRRVLRRYGASFDATELADMVAEVWVVILRDDRRKLRQYDPNRGYRLSSWIGLIATNCAIDQLRARSAEHSYLEEMPTVDRVLVDLSSPQSRLEQIEASRLAQAALERLDAADRDFVVACFHEERSPATLAAELGVSVNTIYSRKFKVRAKLARIATSLLEPTRLAA
jgi:RNA polymerase sigma-70 factor (ECF subfamily)